MIFFAPNPAYNFWRVMALNESQIAYGEWPPLLRGVFGDGGGGLAFSAASRLSTRDRRHAQANFGSAGRRLSESQVESESGDPEIARAGLRSATALRAWKLQTTDRHRRAARSCWLKNNVPGSQTQDNCWSSGVPRAGVGRTAAKGAESKTSIDPGRRATYRRFRN